ncbi:hypothetical protein CYMTET_17053 [Cymbomonas tetramitiformis]|uniref:Acetyl-CoA carboxylase n=1 Tax=Cymbomonas tetramitiformis TaxID=36881 RepID=A0AAE0GAW6_9CHLO|nr:hypothetical protein CYMTET_17053 [Cymbomonas tetramitiformis]
MSESAMQQLIKDYVEARGGKRVIRRILVANNGLAAVRFIRRLREWSFKNFGTETALHFICMATPEDVGANAEYFRLADEYVLVEGGSNKNNYAKVDLIVSTAVNVKADAVWPGWGHASENPNLPFSLRDAGITFLGPPGEAMDAVGDKINANLLAQSVGVNVIPWSGSGLKSDSVKLSDDLISQATLKDLDALKAAAPKVGYPMMIKASEGGGGKGIRMVKNLEEAIIGFDQVQKEVVGSPIFIQKLGINARHLEVQVVADEYGEAITLYGRDCSVQRRHQKLFEEGPVTICSQDLCGELEKGAARLAKFVGYRSAGTVEYLYSVDTKEYSFLEVNPRLQVEHPVTEGITGVCVPAVQLNVGMGIPLHRIPDIRTFYGFDADGSDKIDFENTTPKKPSNHTVAARITAENIDDGFKPTSGAIHEFFYRPVSGVAASFSVSTKGGVHQFADSQFGHLFSSAATREEAIKQLIVAVRDLTIRGEIANNLPALSYILESDAFRTDTHHTGWLDGLIASNTPMVPEVPNVTAVVCGSVIITQELFQSNKAVCLEELGRGVVPDSMTNAFSRHKFDLIFRDVKYPIQTSAGNPLDAGSLSLVNVMINGCCQQAKVITMFDNGLKVLYNGKAHVCYSERTATGLKVVVDGKICFFPDDTDPTALQTVSAGKLVSYLVEDGDVVQPGQAYAEIEVMKTIVPLLALNGPGKVTLLKTPGVPLDAGDMLAKLELADGAEVKVATPFTGTVDPIMTAVPKTLAELTAACQMVMDGYSPLGDATDCLAELLKLEAAPEEVAAALCALIASYIEVETLFDEAPTYMDAVLELREANKADLAKVAAYALSHTQIAAKNAMMMSMMASLKSAEDLTDFIESLAKLANFTDVEYAEVAQKAKELLFGIDQSQRMQLGKARSSTAGGGGMGSPKGSFSSIASFDSDEGQFDDPVLKPSAKRASTLREAQGIPSIDVESIFNSEDASGQAAAVKAYFDLFGVNNAIQNSQGTIKMQYGNGASAFVVPMLEMVPEILRKVESEGVLTRVSFLVPRDEDCGEAEVQKLMAAETEALSSGELLKVSFTLLEEKSKPIHMTYCKKLGFAEDSKFRDVEPVMALQMELDRLCNFSATKLSESGSNAAEGTPDYRMTVFYAAEKSDAAPSSRVALDSRVFARAVVYNPSCCLVGKGKGGLSKGKGISSSGSGGLRRNSSFSSANSLTDVMNDDPEKVPATNVLVDMMRNVELTGGERKTAWNYMFVNLVSVTAEGSLDQAEETVRLFVKQYLPELCRLKVSWVEVKAGSGRVIAYNPAGNRFKVERYMDDEMSGEAEQPYPVLNRIQRKQMVAQKTGSTYVYDFVDLFHDRVAEEDPLALTSTVSEEDHPFKATELVLNAEGNLEASTRPAGNNDVGMVAFRCWMRTPECRSGREFILVGSDLSHQSGSFSPREDIVYYKALEVARNEGIPSVYISANSGARIGLNEEAKQSIQVAWAVASDPSKGFKYLYYTEADYKKLEGNLFCEKITDEGETRYRIVDIYGGCGVECLQGSGMIAQQTSAAYDDTFTLSYITGRSVGIGAYISRLSQRVIQHCDAPLILTGAAALNKVLGRQVYASNAQIGGPKVMFNNGVTHQVVRSDAEGCASILRWLSYIPASRACSLPIYPSSDPVDRPVDWAPGAGPYDPRCLLQGGEVDGFARLGFFDSGSWTECLGDWGKTVVTGRARLGGLPCGVVAVETRTQERTVPADPGFPGATVQVMQQAGNVWFPDSAYKTANSINDFNREGLPLFIFANWRGFAGGQRDMFDEVLKYGSYIVDALRAYKQPVFVYLPTGAELRGGAWVVIDPTINPDMMRMYAADTAKGNVLEPEGIVEIKFRKADLLKAMKRLDPVYAKLEGAEAKAREKLLLPIYTQIAVKFASLHDTPGVMKHKGVISEVVPWKDSRVFFYKALRRRLAEVDVAKELGGMNPSLSKEQIAALMETELKEPLEDLATGVCTMEDLRIAKVAKSVHSQYVTEQVAKMPVEAVIAGLLKDRTAAELVALLPK